MKRTLIVLMLLAAGSMTAAAAGWWAVRPAPARGLVLYGNVDLRQVQLAFSDAERIDAVLVQEGDRVHRGQIVARLDASRLGPQLAQAAAIADAQRIVVLRLRNGSRPEEIAQARANVASATADDANTRGRYQRLRSLAGFATSQQDVDDAQSAYDVADARLAVVRRALDLAIAGPRQEDIAQAEAQLRADAARLAYVRQSFVDAQLVSPADAVVRTRLMEPGEIASPDKPVLSLAITDPKWVRAYVAEPDLGRLHTGMAARIRVDGDPHRQFEGWLGFISPVAEFTPKSVQSEELRTSLVYEVRVFVKDPQDALHLGTPATVELVQPGPAATAHS